MLKVGDKVKVIEKDLTAYGSAGQIVYIKDSQFTKWPYVVKLSSIYIDFSADELEKIE